MRRLVSIGVVAAALMGVSATHAGAAHAGNPRVRLTLVTLPRIPGIRFSLDGTTIVTGKTGRARIETTRGRHLLTVLDTFVKSRGVESRFVRWGEGGSKFEHTRSIDIDHDTTLTVGFEQSVRVHYAFTDRTGRPVFQVSTMTVSGELGYHRSFAPEYPPLLQATALHRRPYGLVSTDIRYSIDKALVNGANVVHQGQKHFYPARTRQVTTRVLLFSARISVRDFIFGTATGSSVDLISPDGTPISRPLHGRTLVLSSLPRGTYQVKVHASGYVPIVTLALSRNEVLQVKVVSYLDMLLFLVLGLALLTALVLIPRPFLRLRLRSLGTGRRPTPDDLEPAKPLSGERRQLVFRYMVPRPPEAAPPRVVRSQARAGSPIVATKPPTSVNLLRQRRSRMRDAASERLHGLQAALRRLLQLSIRPRSGTAAPPEEVLSGERLELIHVYMGEEVASAASMTEATPLPAAAGTSELADTSLAPASEPRPGASGPGEPGEPSTAVAAPSRPEPAEDETSATPAQRRAPARRRAPAAKKAATTAKAKTRAPSTRTPSGSPKQKTRTPDDALPASNGGTEDLSLLRPDLAAAVETLQEDLRQARSSASPSRQKDTAPAEEAAAPAKPKHGRSVANPKATTKKAAATTPAKRKAAGAAKPKAKTAKAKKPTPASRSTNGGTEDLSLLRPDLAAAVEALQEDLRNARTSTQGKSRRKSSTKATR